MTEKSFPLIDGCFILEKKKVKDKAKHISDMVEFAYPDDLIKHEKQTIDLMLKYVFPSLDITKIDDDQFNSRRNEITFGTPYEDYSYAF